MNKLTSNKRHTLQLIHIQYRHNFKVDYIRNMFTIIFYIVRYTKELNLANKSILIFSFSLHTHTHTNIITIFSVPFQEQNFKLSFQCPIQSAPPRISSTAVTFSQDTSNPYKNGS